MSERRDDLVRRLSAKPWNAAPVPDAVHRPVGMIGPEERRALWWLAREMLGDGAIVDAGCFLGASTFCLAAGAAASPRSAGRRGPIVHAFDYFRAVDEYVAESISRQVRPTRAGDSYLDVFLGQVAPHAELVRAVPGDFLQASWNEGPIDLLFVDVAKTEALNAHAVGMFLPSLVPGRSVIVQQDFHHCWHPAIHVAMEHLAEELVELDELIEHQSRLWLLDRPIPAEKIRRLASRELGAAERLALLDRLVERSSPRSRPMMEVVRCWQRFLDGDLDGAEAGIGGLRSRFDVEKTADLWARQALEVEAQIRRRREAAPPTPAVVVPAPPEPAVVETIAQATVDPREAEFAAAAKEVRRRRRFVLEQHPRAAVASRWPDFLVIGAQKSGTTWLHGNLLYHPEVWVPPIKELNYLNHRFAPSADGWEATSRVRQAEDARRYYASLPALRGVQVARARALEACGRAELDEAGYRSIFACADPDQACGEISPDYCMLPREAVRFVASRQPAIRVLLILRDPVERAISNMTMAFRHGYGPDPAVGVGEGDLGLFVSRSNYPSMIARWRTLLPAGSLHLLSYDDIRDRPDDFLAQVCRILGVLPDQRLFPKRHEVIGGGEPTRVHPSVRATLEDRLGFVYEEMRDLAPAIAERWEDHRRLRSLPGPASMSAGA